MTRYANYSDEESETTRLIKQISLVYIGSPIMVVGVFTSLLTLIIFWLDTLTFISTR